MARHRGKEAHSGQALCRNGLHHIYSIEAENRNGWGVIARKTSNRSMDTG
jgi:hypothetical protein